MAKDKKGSQNLLMKDFVNLSFCEDMELNWELSVTHIISSSNQRKSFLPVAYQYDI